MSCCCIDFHFRICSILLLREVQRRPVFRAAHTPEGLGLKQCKTISQPMMIPFSTLPRQYAAVPPSIASLNDLTPIMPAWFSRTSLPAVATVSSCDSISMRQCRLLPSVYSPNRLVSNWKLLTMILLMAMSSAFSAVGAQGTWSTAQLSVARAAIVTASVGNVALFAGGSESLKTSVFNSFDCEMMVFCADGCVSLCVQ